MADFSFVKNPKNKNWVILAPRRRMRPNESDERIKCPFCVGVESREEELFRIGGVKGDVNWKILVIKNKYPFSLHHEVIIDSSSHVESIDTFSLDHLAVLLGTYKERFMQHHHLGQVCIFHNRGSRAGESIMHSHTQLVVIPEKVNLKSVYLSDLEPEKVERIETKHFYIFCSEFSEWPDEVFIMPKRRNELFGEVKEGELLDLAYVLQMVIRLLSLRHQDSLAYNFSIFHNTDWFLRIVPREKVLGGFEVATGVPVNTQDPRETFNFLKQHFSDPDMEKIFKEHQALYARRV